MLSYRNKLEANKSISQLPYLFDETGRPTIYFLDIFRPTLSKMENNALYKLPADAVWFSESSTLTSLSSLP